MYLYPVNMEAKTKYFKNWVNRCYLDNRLASLKSIPQITFWCTILTWNLREDSDCSRVLESRGHRHNIKTFASFTHAAETEIVRWSDVRLQSSRLLAVPSEPYRRLDCWKSPLVWFPSGFWSFAHGERWTICVEWVT